MLPMDRCSLLYYQLLIHSFIIYRCKISTCAGLLRPHVVWFGENLEEDVLNAVQEELDDCDLCMLVSLYYLLLTVDWRVDFFGLPV